MYFLLGIDDTDSSTIGEPSISPPNTTTLAITLGLKLDSMRLARLINVSCHQLFQHPAVLYTNSNTAYCLLLESDSEKIREIDMLTRSTLRSQSAPTANPGYALAAWNQFDPEIVAWGKTAKSIELRRMDAINLAKRCGIATAGISGSGAGVIGALAAIGLRYDGNDGFIAWMPGLDKLDGVFTPVEINEFIHFESIVSENNKHPALDDRIRLTGDIKPLLKEGRIVLQIASAKRGADFEWQSSSY